MKVLIWSQHFWPENFHINTVAQSLQSRGVEVTVLTGKPNYPEGRIFEGYRAAGIHEEKYDAMNVVRIPLFPRGKNSGKRLFFNYISFILSGYIFAPFALRRKEFDVVFVYAPSPLLQALAAVYVSWLKRAPLVLWVQDIWPDVLVATGFIKSRFILRVVGEAVRYIYRYSDSILIQSEEFRPPVERWSPHHSRIRYFPNSTDSTQLLSETSAKGAQVANAIAANFSIVFAGNIGTAQSCQTIIDAANMLKHIDAIKFFLVGEGRMADEIAKRIESQNLNNVVMTGRLPNSDMGAVYASSSVLLLTLRDEPSLSLTIPSKLQSYLYAAKPILASCNGAAASVLLQANAGLACPAADAQALAEAVLKLFEMTVQERQLLGENGRAYFNAHFQLQKRMDELEEHLRTVVDQFEAKKKGHPN